MADIRTMPERRYFLKSTEDCSAKYGPCEVCGKAVSEVFHQWQDESYSVTIEGVTETGWARVGTELFGHEECLIQSQEVGAANVA